MIELAVALALFTGVFYTLIHREQSRFERYGRLAKAFFGLTVFFLLLLLIDSGLGPLFLFFLLFLSLAGASYHHYLKRNRKVGFIGLCFCLTFAGLFAYLQFFLLNF